MSDIANVLVGNEGRVGGVWIQSQRGGADMLLHVARMLREHVDAWRDAARLRALLVVHLETERLSSFVFSSIPTVRSPHPSIVLFVESGTSWQSTVSVAGFDGTDITMTFAQITSMPDDAIMAHFAPVWR